MISTHSKPCRTAIVGVSLLSPGLSGISSFVPLDYKNLP
jgi:hypothetical protein